jgi:hypothetical protein
LVASHDEVAAAAVVADTNRGSIRPDGRHSGTMG